LYRKGENWGRAPASGTQRRIVGRRKEKNLVRQKGFKQDGEGKVQINEALLAKRGKVENGRGQREFCIFGGVGKECPRHSGTGEGETLVKYGRGGKPCLLEGEKRCLGGGNWGAKNDKGGEEGR